MMEAQLRDRRVLIVEDEYLIAQAMGRSLTRAGAVVLGPVPSVDQAMALLAREEEIDGAVLDINLGEQRIYPVLDALLARGAQCVFATGNDPADVPAAYAGVTRCEKPISYSCIIEALTELPSNGPKAGCAPLSDREPIEALRDELVRQIETADRAGQTLLTAKLCEALDVAIAVLRQ